MLPRNQDKHKASREAGMATDYKALFRELIARANSGERAAIELLRKFLDDNPQIWEEAGDLNVVAERAWTELIAGQDRLTGESLKRKLVRLKEELKGPHPTRLESLLADHVAICWLAAQHGVIEAASPAGSSLDHAMFQLKRAESAQRRFLLSAKTLVTLRSFSARGLAPLNSIHMFDAEQKLA